MSKLMISTAMTIDGAIEVGDWYVGEGEHSRAAFDMLGSVDALLMGRKTYEGLAAYWAPLEDKWANLLIPLVGGRIVRGGTPMFGNVQPASLVLLETRTFEGSDNVLLRYATRRESD